MPAIVSRSQTRLRDDWACPAAYFSTEVYTGNVWRRPTFVRWVGPRLVSIVKSIKGQRGRGSKMVTCRVCLQDVIAAMAVQFSSVLQPLRVCVLSSNTFTSPHTSSSHLIPLLSTSHIYPFPVHTPSPHLPPLPPLTQVDATGVMKELEVLLEQFFGSSTNDQKLQISELTSYLHPQAFPASSF